jgi:hypothetical protein
MKNSPLLLLPALLLALFSPACKDKCDTGDFGITSLQPSANPAGYEIFIEAKGVTANTRVRFDEVDAASVKTAEGGLIVKVPTGVSGPVSLSIEEGSCSDSRSFEVLGTYPGNVPDHLHQPDHVERARIDHGADAGGLKARSRAAEEGGGGVAALELGGERGGVEVA